MKLQSKMLIAVLALALVAPLAAAKKKSKKEMKAEMDAMMAQMVKSGTPGENHRILASLAGTYTVTMRSWMQEGDKPQESTGTQENTMINGGRFLKQEFKGNWAGQPFEGIGFTGYDNNRAEFESTWMDTMSTAIMKVTGQYDPATQTISFAGTMSCPATGDKNRAYRSEWKIVDANTNIYSSYDKSPDGKEFKSMEITYTRAK